MSRHELTVETTVRTAPDRLWAVLSDLGRSGEWMAHVTDVDAPPRTKLGSTFRITAQYGSHTMVSRVKITEYDAPKRLAWIHVEDLLDGNPFRMAEEGTTSFELAQDKAGTLLLVQVGFMPRGLAARLGATYFMHRRVKPELEESVVRLKRLAEART